MKRARILFPALLALLMAAGGARASFEGLPGLRISALGGAAAADGGDAMGFFINPASSAWGRASSLEMYYSRLYWGLENATLTRNTIGGYSSFGNWGAIALGHDRFDSRLYAESQTLLGYARQIGHVSLGVGLDLLAHSYGETPYTAVDPLFKKYGYSTNRIAVDLGTQWRINNRLAVGLAGRRLNRPNQAIENGGSDPVPCQVQAGIAWRIGLVSLFGDIEYRDLPVNGMDLTPRFGVEAGLFDRRLFLRGGFNRDEITSGFGINIYQHRSTGSYSVPTENGATKRIKESRDLRFRLAYTFRYPIGGIAGTYGTHLVGINVFFDREREQTSPAHSSFMERPATPRERVIVKKDTVYVPEVKFVRVEVEDSAKIKAYKVEILGLREEISSLRNLNLAMGHLETALKLYYQKLYQEAIKKCNEAINLVPTLDLGYIRKGSIYYAMGDYKNARLAWQEALKRDPGNEEIKRYLRDLDEGKVPKTPLIDPNRK